MNLPDLPNIDTGLAGIHNYLRDLDFSVRQFMSSVIINPVGMIGVRGFSATGTAANNFVMGSLQVNGVSSAMWVFDNIESDTSYMVFYNPRIGTASMSLTTLTQSTTNVMFGFVPTSISGMLLNVMLLR